MLLKCITPSAVHDLLFYFGVFMWILLSNKQLSFFLLILILNKQTNIKYDVICLLQDLTMESMARYVSPINPAVFPHLTVVLLGIGIFFMAWFFVYPLQLLTTSFSAVKMSLVINRPVRNYLL